MSELAVAFEEHRSRLRAVAYRMLGSPAEADDAMQEAWIKLAAADASAIQNVRAWLTTVVARVCLDTLRTRGAQREEPLPTAPEPIAPGDAARDLELADSVGLALLVVLDKLDPAARLAFVLHDLFAMPFVEIAPIVGRSASAVRQLASRARRRVQGVTTPDVDLGTQRRVVEAFLAALREGDIEGLVAVLDPDVLARADVAGAGGVSEVRGAREWARGAVAYRRAADHMRPMLIDGRVGIALAPGGKVARVMVFGFVGATICEAEVIADPDALGELVVEQLGACVSEAAILA